MVIIKGDFVSPAPLRAPPRENSIPMSGCNRAKIHKNTTVNLITSESSIKNLLKPNESIIVEDFIKGIELSSIYICNPNASKKTIGLPWVKDYKSRDEYNSGPNTGGMGAITHPYCSFKKNDVYSLNTEIEKIIIKIISVR